MEAKWPLKINCVGCRKIIDLVRVTDLSNPPGERSETAPGGCGAMYDGACRECKCLYRTLVAPYNLSSH